MKLVVLGAGGHAKVVIGAAEAAGYTIDGVYDDREETWGTAILSHPVLGPLNDARKSHAEQAVLAIGSNAVRRRLVATLDFDWTVIVHPTAWVHNSVALDEGTVVLASAVIQPDTRVGSHAIINTAATVDHEGRIGSYAHVGPGAHLSGNVTVGEGAFVGTGAAIREGIEIGVWATVGLGAAVVRPVPAYTTVVGVPARPLQ